MYSVHCRVIVDNKCEFQHSSSRVDCTVWCKTREPNVEEKLEEFNKHVCQRILIKQFTVSTRQTLVQIQPGPEKTSALCHHRAFMGWKLSPTLKSVNVDKNSRYILSLQLLPWSAHDTSVSMVTINADHSCFSPGLYVHIGYPVRP